MLVRIPLAFFVLPTLAPLGTALFQFAFRLNFSAQFKAWPSFSLIFEVSAYIVYIAAFALTFFLLLSPFIPIGKERARIRALRAIERNRLSRYLGVSVSMILSDCASSLYAIDRRLSSPMWTVWAKDSHYGRLRDEVALASNDAMNEALSLFDIYFEGPPRTLTFSENISTLFGGQPPDMVPSQYAEARRLGERLRELLAEVDKVSEDLADKLGADVPKAIDQLVTRLRDTRTAEAEIQNDQQLHG